MIRNSFIMLDRFSLATEQRLWAAGIDSWDDFYQHRVPGIGPARKLSLERHLAHLDKALNARDIRVLAETFPQREHWRLLPIASNILYVDIETVGYGDITVVGAFDGETYYNFVKGCNLDREMIRALFAQYDVFVTFNGSSFDIPVMERFFNGIMPPAYVHVDMRHVLARCGFVGGLKSIESQLGIHREASVASVHGGDAMLLWQEYCLTGEEEFVELLLQYNEADCRNLEPLCQFAIQTLWQQLRVSRK